MERKCKRLEKVFNSRLSAIPTWLSIALWVLVLSGAILVFSDLAGVMDFVAQSSPMEVKEYDMGLLEDSGLLTQLYPILEKRAERGMFSYYLEAYPMFLGVELMSKVSEVASYMTTIYTEKAELVTQAEKDAYVEANIEDMNTYVAEFEDYKEGMLDILHLSVLASGFYQIVSIGLAILILRIPTGIRSKLIFAVTTKKMRWLF